MVMDQEPMEAQPAPDVVGREFVRQYYTLLHDAPEFAHRFYNSNSYFVHGSMSKPAIGQLEIHRKIQQLNFRDCHAKISQVDSQVTLGNGVVVQVSGELSNDGLPMRRFSQTFVLGTQSPKKYYVHNDIFRYQDMLQSDEENETPGEKDETAEMETIEPREFYPMEETVPQQQQQPPVTPGLNVNAPPHTVHVNVNGNMDVDEPLVIGEPMTVPLPVPEPAPAPPPPVVNGANNLTADDIGVILPAIQPEPQQSRPSNVHLSTEDLNQQASDNVNSEDDSFQAPGDASDMKPTFANLVRTGNRINRATPPARSLRSAPPSQPATPGPHPASVETSPPQRSEPVVDVPQTGSRYNDNHQVFMGNIPSNASENDLRPLFELYGRVIDLRINQNRTRENPNKNYGFVTFEAASAVTACLQKKQIFLNENPINVEEKKRQANKGSGGRGDSGHETGGWSMGRGQAGRGRGPPRNAPRGPPFNRGSAPAPTRPPYPAKR